ncbi:hypothetical protein V5N11_004450 [Cardamine amara subsp. amara]|uniref:GRF-type domain-containing protein n=1 Tax=Cardamine amara subsp. amara TaxID=228776 RepID=A0ABD1C057_CARAN
MSCSSETSCGGGRGIPSKCVCGLPTIIFTSKTQDNPGRPFFRCASKRDDHFFKWVEDAVLEEVEELKDVSLKIKSEADEFKEMLLKTKSEVEEFKTVIGDVMEAQMWSKKEIWKLKIMIKVFFSWAFFMSICVVFLMFRKANAKKLVLGY